MRTTNYSYCFSIIDIRSTKYLLFIGFLLLLNSSIPAQDISLIDSLIANNKNLIQDSNRVNNLNAIALEYINNAKYPDGLSFAKEAYLLSDSIKFKRGNALSSECLGDIYRYLSSNEKALFYYLEALAYHESQGDIRKSIANYFSIQYIHQSNNNFEKQLEVNIKTLELSNKIKDSIAIFNSYRHITSSYFKLCQKSLNESDTINANLYYNKILEYTHLLLDFAQGGKDSAQIRFCLFNLAFTYDKCNLIEIPDSLHRVFIISNDFFNASIKTYFEVLAAYEKENDSEGVASSYYNISHFYKNQGNLQLLKRNTPAALDNYQNAYKNISEGLRLIRKLGFDHGIANYSMEAGIILSKLGEHSKSITYLKTALDIFDRRQFKIGMKECYYYLYMVYNNIKDYKSALFNYLEYAKLDNFINNENTAKNINELNIRYETNKKDNDIQLLSKENEIKASENKRAVFIRNSVVIFSSITLLMMLLLFNNIRNKRRREKAELSSQLLEVKQEAINAQISDHFIGNAMNSINEFIENNDKDRASEYLIKFSRLIRNVLETSFSKFVTLQHDLDILNDYIELEKLQFSGKGLLSEIIIDKTIDAESAMIPPMIFQILTENSIKHGIKKSVGGNIKIEIERADNQLVCRVEDNGIGRIKSSQDKDPGNNSKKSIGGGLAEKLVKLLNQDGTNTSFKITDLVDENNQSLGTRVEFSIPYIVS